MTSTQWRNSPGWGVGLGGKCPPIPGCWEKMTGKNEGSNKEKKKGKNGRRERKDKEEKEGKKNEEGKKRRKEGKKRRKKRKGRKRGRKLVLPKKYQVNKNYHNAVYKWVKSDEFLRG